MLQPVGKVLIVVGLVIAAVGIAIVLSDKAGWIGRLPGDFVFRRKNVTVYFPLATSILISVVLSLLFWLFRK